MRWVLMYEDPTAFHLFPMQLHHDLHVSDTLNQLTSFSRAIRDKGLELAEGHTRWASYENQRLFPVDVFFGLPSMIRDIEIPSSGEVHGVPHIHAEFGGFLANPWR